MTKREKLIAIADKLTEDDFILIEKIRTSTHIGSGDCLTVLDIFKNAEKNIIFFDCYNEFERTCIFGMIDLVNDKADFDKLERAFPGYDDYWCSCYKNQHDRIYALEWLQVAITEDDVHPALEDLKKQVDDIYED
ncbi:MAG: hypothetical protein Q4B67_03600 [Eubacteriales bacterium]|nr:hypothetical protein [Eubacteriales bacterium]